MLKLLICNDADLNVHLDFVEYLSARHEGVVESW